MQTTIFDWAYHQHMTLRDLADKLGYSQEHLSRLRSGKLPVTEQFRDRCIARLGPWAASLFFLPNMTAKTTFHPNESHPAEVAS